MSNSNNDFQNIHFDIADNGVARLTFNRPDKLNSFTEEMFEEIRAALLRVQTTKGTRCLIISGAGRGFCAGQDLGDLDFSNLSDTVENNYNPLVRNIASLDMPVVAAVNGVAAGAGANIALACDIVIAARSASFVQSFCNIGLVPDAGGTWSLPRLVGGPRAMAMAMLGDKISAQQAEQWGMIWQCVDDAELGAVVDRIAERFSSAPTTGLAFMKKLIRQSWDHTLDSQLDLERDFQAAASQTSDFREGVQAFLEKRPPAFTGS